MILPFRCPSSGIECKECPHKSNGLGGDMEKLLLRIPEVVAAMGLGMSTIYLLLDRPDGLPTVRIGRSVRVPAEAVRRWVETQASIQDKCS